ncbi:MAG: hypothetical protein COU07_03625 [Candidatus Harrisonbacteria bacterium CG10_big_fil_rev_8_21_14_0_10_40_38]|uniref:Uncharacterized protein n=1 Tax=Candidatus Harrisonbacteria bacterium CG10_big_fil_rev_8_21_14_0_10_40_38 TaxID=1974583 RepID=A0A2H0UTI3_9BACT|nr:MAG: hypothetical protein COU07_03625 [Candidatus Harrisonbacteria bacterium CG10_big_fil_rev_8_21_14_0_10_40_38]
MRKDKESAIKLRLLGKSYREINESIGVPKSTLSDWLSKIILSKNTLEKINKRTQKKSLKALIKRNKYQTIQAQKRALELKKEGASEITNFSKKDLLIAGTALYWAEGYKRQKTRNGRPLTSHPVSLTNSDPILIKVFLKFLIEIYNIPKKDIKLSIRIFEHQNEEELIKFWQNITNFPRENFKKSYYGISKSSLNKRPFNRLPYGTLEVRVNNTKLYHKIMGHIEGIKNFL